MPDRADGGIAGSAAGQGSKLSLREMLSIPYRIEARTSEGENGDWLRRAVYPELPGCMAEAPTIEDALRQLKRRRIEIIVGMLRSGGQPPMPRPPLRDCDPEGVARELGLGGLVAGLLDHSAF